MTARRTVETTDAHQKLTRRAGRRGAAQHHDGEGAGMKTYTVLYAEDVPHYAFGEIEARSPKAALAKARKMNTDTFTAFEPDWDSSVCRRIVFIEDPVGVIAEDIALDQYHLRNGGDADRHLCDAAAAMLAALEAQEMAEHDPEAARRKGYFDIARDLRKAAIAKARGTT